MEKLFYRVFVKFTDVLGRERSFSKDFNSFSSADTYYNARLLISGKSQTVMLTSIERVYKDGSLVTTCTPLADKFVK